MDELFIFTQDFTKGKVNEGIFSAPTKKEYTYKKCKITLIKLKDDLCYQVEFFTQKQAFHKNILLSEVESEITKLFEDFSQLEYTTDEFTYNLKITKKNKLLHTKKRLDNSLAIVPKSHNREKEYILKEGNIIPPLIDLGIFTKDGRIVKSMYDKYKQINRFIEFVDDTIKSHPPKSLNIIDFGCGKSYLTFVLYYYLTQIMHIQTQITGMDLKEEVIENCNKIAKGYGYENLQFIAGDIANYIPDKPLDMVITLHACDVATDFALKHAVNMGSKIILSVPCCQHQLNAQIDNDHQTIMTRYGIIKERFSALSTDAIRANWLELQGYNTQLLEFVDMSHSPKNILIRAIKNNKPCSNPEIYQKEIDDICKQYGFTPEILK